MHTKKKDPSKLRNKTIQVSVTEREEKLITVLAEKRHLTNSTFVRVILLDYINKGEE